MRLLPTTRGNWQKTTRLTRRGRIKLPASDPAVRSPEDLHIGVDSPTDLTLRGGRNRCPCGLGPGINTDGWVRSSTRRHFSPEYVAVTDAPATRYTRSA